MPKELERDLGLYATITISIGAMIGSGIFVLPGFGAAKAGPSVVLAYLLAGLIVLPAALAKAEMATALPESGGTYLYIDRAMGPLLGTIAGVGAWFSLIFKSAFALVGLGAYLALLVGGIPPGSLVYVSLGLAAVLVVVNVVGVKQTGRLQAVIVSFVLLSLLGFIADGLTFVDGVHYRPVFSHGAGGLFAATGLVFVSYAGVTKIASVAEEVEQPGRNIPIAILCSVVVMMLVYTLTVFVIVGVVPITAIHESSRPMAIAAAQFLGTPGKLVVSAVAVLALTSMANAGVLSSSRYPLAMSRDALAPPAFSYVSDRFKTPALAVGFTGVLLLVLIRFVPVVELAKLASAFQILVFTLINVALVAFRESELEWYDPAFIAPGYPWVQAVGVFGGLGLLTQMGTISLAGAIGIVGVGVVWYWIYGHERTEREGASVDALRRTAGSRKLTQTKETLSDSRGNVLVAMDPNTTKEQERTLLTVAGAIAAQSESTVYAVRFEAVPDQLTLASATDLERTNRQFESQTRSVAKSLPAEVEAHEIVAHDVRRAVINYARDIDADVLLGQWQPDRLHARLLGTDVDWFMDHAPCEVVFLRDRGLEAVDEITVLTGRGPYDSFKVLVANAVARQYDASIRFVTAVGREATTEQIDAIQTFHRDLEQLCAVSVESEIIRSDSFTADLTDTARTSDIAVLGTVAHSYLHELVFGDPASEISDRVDCTVLLVHPRASKGRTFLREIFERIVF